MNASELKTLRHTLGLTQDELGKRLGITRNAVAKLEAGHNRMSKPVAMLCQQLVNHRLVIENP